MNNNINRNYVTLFKSVRELSEYDCITDNILREQPKKKEKCFKVLTLNLIYSLSKGYEGVYLSSRKKSYTAFVIINGYKYRSEVYYAGAMEWICAMQDAGYIIHHKGNNLPKTKEKGWVEITAKFKDEVGDLSEVRECVSGKAITSEIKLRDSVTKEDKVFGMTTELKKIEIFIKNYNKAMSEQANVTLNGKRVNCDMHRLYLDTIGVYGRFHSQVVNLKKEDRKGILFDGDETCEVDLVASHLSILYAENNEDITQYADPYDLRGYLTPDIEDKVIDYAITNFHSSGNWFTERDIYKAATVIAINTASMSQAINTLSNKREEFGKVVNGDRDLIKNLLVAVESKHSKIKDSLFKSQATALMGKESDWMLEVLVELTGVHGIPVIPVHDGVLCAEWEADFVKETMRALFKSKFGYKCNVKIKN